MASSNNSKRTNATLGKLPVKGGYVTNPRKSPADVNALTNDAPQCGTPAENKQTRDMINYEGAKEMSRIGIRRTKW